MIKFEEQRKEKEKAADQQAEGRACRYPEIKTSALYDAWLFGFPCFVGENKLVRFISVWFDAC